MELIWLEDFAALAEKLNFSRAAEARHVTQPAFGRRIRALEEWVGTDLFSRTTHGVSLTASGAYFSLHVGALTRSLHQLRTETLEIAGREKIGLSFAATHALSFSFFPDWVMKLEQFATFGALNLVSDTLEACEKIMLQGTAQFLLCHHSALTPSGLDERNFISMTVGTDVLVPVCAKNAGGHPLWELSDESEEPLPLLGYRAESGLGRIMAADWAAKGNSPRLNMVLTSHLAATLLSMARARRGIAWLPLTLARADIENGALTLAGGERWHIPIQIRLFRPRRRQSQTAEHFWSTASQGSY
jgi:DNA-binding transcriptional LysR family regulator